MKKLLLVLSVALVFLGCGTHVETKSADVSVTTADGSTYNFSGNIIIDWYSYDYVRNDKMKIQNVRVEVGGVQYPTNWTWSKKIKDFKQSDIDDGEASIYFSFNLKLPSSSEDRACVLRYTIKLDDETKNDSINCVIPSYM